MIEPTDIAMMQFLKAQLPANFTLVWTPTQLSRQALANVSVQAQEQAPDAEPTVTTGIPGASVFRTMSRRMIEAFNVPQAKDGFIFSQDAPTTGPTRGNFNALKRISTKVQYDISIWTKFQSDLNQAERILAFLDINQHLTTTFADAGGNENTFTFPVLWASDVTYNWDINKNTARVEYYGLTKSVRVDTMWALGEVVPIINQIQVIYKQLTNGEPITSETLDILSALEALDPPMTIPSS
jgi:hypothetical protein